MSDKITITKTEYLSLKRDSAHLNVLEMLGVDNWGGYVGPYAYCSECEEEGTWDDENCSECGAEMPDPFDCI